MYNITGNISVGLNLGNEVLTCLAIGVFYSMNIIEWMGIFFFFSSGFDDV